MACKHGDGGSAFPIEGGDSSGLNCETAERMFMSSADFMGIGS